MPTPHEYGMPAKHIPGDEGYITITVERIQEKAARLKGQRAKGPGGDYNEHMAPYARTHPPESPEAQVMQHYAKFVELYVNARLPAWYYRLSAAARLVALLKPEWDGKGTPPAKHRPLPAQMMTGQRLLGASPAPPPRRRRRSESPRPAVAPPPPR